MIENLSAVIITKNEEANIGRCLESIRDLVSEIVIVDSQSTDRTLEICKEYGCNVFQIEWQGFGHAKNYAVNKAKNDWILSIDADEEVTTELKNEIERILEKPTYNVYYIKRKSFFIGKEIKHCGWGNDYPKRLFNRKYGNFNRDIVHESVEITGERGRIESVIKHYTYPTIFSQIKKMNLYSELGAKKYFDDGKKASPISALFFGLLNFIKMYVFQLGFLDGVAGLILCINNSYGIFLKYIKLWNLYKEAEN